MTEVVRGGFGGEPEGTVCVARLNLTPGVPDVESNLALAEQEVRAAASARGDLRWVVLPELFTSAYSSLGNAHAAEGESARRFAALARELGIYVAYGFPERLPGSAYLYDSANLVGPEGVLLTRRKRHLVRTTREPALFGRVGLAGRRGRGDAGGGRHLLGFGVPGGGARGRDDGSGARPGVARVTRPLGAAVRFHLRRWTTAPTSRAPTSSAATRRRASRPPATPTAPTDCASPAPTARPWERGAWTR